MLSEAAHRGLRKAPPRKPLISLGEFPNKIYNLRKQVLYELPPKIPHNKIRDRLPKILGAMVWNTLNNGVKNKEFIAVLKRKLRLEMETVAFVQLVNRHCISFNVN